MDGPYLVYLLSIDGHLSCFHFLASVNNAVTYRDVKILLSVLLDLYSKVELLGHLAILFNFLKNHHSVTAAAPSYILTSCAQGLQCPHLFTGSCYGPWFWLQPSQQGTVVCCCAFLEDVKPMDKLREQHNERPVLGVLNSFILFISISWRMGIYTAAKSHYAAMIKE